MRKFKDFVISVAGRQAMSRGMKKYWAEVHDGTKSRPKHYNITTHDLKIDQENGHDAQGVHFRIEKTA